MNILYIGDIMGEAGMQAVERVLPSLRRERKIDLVIAQSENVTRGKGTNISDFRKLQSIGVDFCTGGNWTLYNDEIFELLNNPAEPIIRPANYPQGTVGLGYKKITINHKTVLVASLLGDIVGRDSDKKVDNPLKVIDEVIKNNKYDFLIVNLHGDYSSQKVVIGHYLDGRATLVVGDHWHVPTADARILPAGTAHITDVGMCGVLNASLGVSLSSVVPRWRDDKQTRNILEEKGELQFNAILVVTNDSGLASSVEQIQMVL